MVERECCWRSAQKEADWNNGVPGQVGAGSAAAGPGVSGPGSAPEARRWTRGV